jgi:hypothetical protein
LKKKIVKNLIFNLNIDLKISQIWPNFFYV